MKKITITIDGYVATGKGTTAIWVARKLWYIYLDTGAMYRAVTLYALQHNLLYADEQTKAEMMGHIDFSFHYNTQTDHDDIYLNGMNVESEIRQVALSLQMKSIVTSPAVRTALWQKQKEFAGHGWFVVDGRDMGTVVFPDAEVKVFLIGNINIRAQRRYEQLLAKWQSVSLDDIYRDINQRDETDYWWPQAVNCKADDAVEIDTSVLTIDEQIDKVYKMAMEKIHH